MIPHSDLMRFCFFGVFFLLKMIIEDVSVKACCLTAAFNRVVILVPLCAGSRFSVTSPHLPCNPGQ